MFDIFCFCFQIKIREQWRQKFGLKFSFMWFCFTVDTPCLVGWASVRIFSYVWNFYTCSVFVIFFFFICTNFIRITCVCIFYGMLTFQFSILRWQVDGRIFVSPESMKHKILWFTRFFIIIFTFLFVHYKMRFFSRDFPLFRHCGGTIDVCTYSFSRVPDKTSFQRSRKCTSVFQQSIGFPSNFLWDFLWKTKNFIPSQIMNMIFTTSYDYIEGEKILVSRLINWQI